MQRPTSVTVFGVLNIVFGALGILGIIFSAISLMVISPLSSTHNPVVQTVRNNPGYAAWMKIAIPLGFLACGVSIAAGIGLLKLKNWARILSIGYAIYAIVTGIIGMVLNYIFLMQPLMEQASQKQGPEAAVLIGAAIGGTFGSCFGMIYPVLLLIFMFRPNVVAAFQPPAEPAGMGPN
jgi:hypothetical protein